MTLSSPPPPKVPKGLCPPPLPDLIKRALEQNQDNLNGNLERGLGEFGFLQGLLSRIFSKVQLQNYSSNMLLFYIGVRTYIPTSLCLNSGATKIRDKFCRARATVS
jgi:hypothetical protein